MRTFTTDAQRLCFRYNAKYIEYDKYLISKQPQRRGRRQVSAGQCG